MTPQRASRDPQRSNAENEGHLVLRRTYPSFLEQAGRLLCLKEGAITHGTRAVEAHFYPPYPETFQKDFHALELLWG
jgi:hypothetical protein